MGRFFSWKSPQGISKSPKYSPRTLQGFCGVERGKKSLVFWLVFVGVYLNFKEQKIRVTICGDFSWIVPKKTIGRREKTPTPKTRFSIWTLLRTPGRFTTRPLPVYFTTKVSVVRLLSKDEIGPWSKTGRFLSKAEILGGVGVFSPLSRQGVSETLL